MDYHPVFGVSVPERGWVPAPRYLLRRHRILKLFKQLSPGNILEIGCGPGALLFDISKLGFCSVALETSPSAFKIAEYVNRDNSNVAILKEPRLDWDEFFDCVSAFEVLEHIEDDHNALTKWRGWLKPNGMLLISVPAHSNRWNATDVWAGHYRRYGKERLVALLENAGFTIEKFECYGFPLGNIIEPIRARHHARQLVKQGSILNQDGQRKANNDRSGVERNIESKLYPLQASWFGTKIMQFFFLIQNIFTSMDWGNGYLVLAKRK